MILAVVSKHLWMVQVFVGVNWAIIGLSIRFVYIFVKVESHI